MKAIDESNYTPTYLEYQQSLICEHLSTPSVIVLNCQQKLLLLVLNQAIHIFTLYLISLRSTLIGHYSQKLSENIYFDFIPVNTVWPTMQKSKRCVVVDLGQLKGTHFVINL